ncbi:DUF3085 domain-containing protein [Mesorhizobium sp. B4-1-4]|uniref:DUF3085 domain-containing protein n=1 Tax=Mesorhizobium sp. B4-1-4 TaxID=2589888 RepID=UPI00112C9E20|nr:DUF3085 domain-containing protein [Mesorhizobium sp. B4-1-4]UCI32024.1 DUF3085 domain-containing protein [Mesorhizobium sp. B4-1-4]
MFTFPILGVRKVIDRGIADAAANGGFRDPFFRTRCNEGDRPGLWLINDEGVYLMSNGKLAEGSPTLFYSEQCHPIGNPDWRDYKRRHFGGAARMEFIEAERLIPLFDRNFRATHLNVQLAGSDIGLSLIAR